SDVPLSGLSDEALSGLSVDAGQVQDVYRCSPLQEGLLAHGLLDRRAYVNQLSLQVRGLCVETLRESAQLLCRRHAILRTGFVFESDTGQALPWPVQVVMRDVQVVPEVLDWTHLDSDEQARRWQLLLTRDRQRGYQLAQAPLWRLVVAECSPAKQGEPGERPHQRVLFSRHHILLDGWCTARLLGELLQVYQARSRGTQLHLPQVPPYRDFIAWWMQQDSAAHSGYWQQQLAGVRAPTPLPLAAQHPSDASGTHQVQAALSREQLDALRAFAAAYDLTLNTLCQGAWALLLWRSSGAREVLYGVTVAGRPAELPRSDEMMGLFINSLPLRIACPSELGLVPWLQTLQTLNSELRQHEHSSLLQLQAQARKRGLRGPLFDSLFVFENYPLDSALSTLTDGQAGGLVVDHAESRDLTHYGLTLVATPAEQLSLSLQYDTSRYSKAQAQRVLGLYQQLLQAIPDKHDTRLAQLSLATTPLLHPRQHSVSGTLVDAFTERVRHAPQATAVRFGNDLLTYAQLDGRANALAHNLRELGVGPEVRVGLRVPRSLELVVAVLGILKAGGCYVPIEPGLVQARQRLIAQDARLSCLVGSQGPDLGLIALDVPEQSQAHPPMLDTRAEHAAYVIYTSGSTGKPKGVPIEHRQVLRLMRACSACFDFTQHDVWTLFHSLAFDFSVWELWGALLHGGQLVVVPHDVARDPQAFHQLLLHSAATVLSQTPSAFYALQHYLVDSPCPALHTVVFGGEALHVERLAPEMLSQRTSQKPRLVNMYGITETTVHVTCGDVSATRPGDIGRELDDLAVVVLDTDGNPTAQGLAGELCIGGGGVGRGYLDRPALTAERFIPNPFGPPGGRLYRSGDLALRQPDGRLRYLGRSDSQVKLRGHRIELGEVAALMRKAPGVRDAVALLRGPAASANPTSPSTPAQRDPRLIAYVVAHSDAAHPDSPAGSRPGSLDTSALRELAQRQLPEYMVPSAVILLPALPLTHNGKLDVDALPLPEHTPHQAARYAPPRNDTERALVAIWAEVLQLPVVGIHDDFFELGGHSLSATRILSEVRARFEVQVPVDQLFDAATVAHLAEVLEAELRGPAGANERDDDTQPGGKS
ncbi:MAG: amino acid adenylation domain-containing protein, partial [Myxococcales bacterium]|nr:amino acid adenylation domain-containing protein [Myxococcales bacterium]